MHLWLKYMCILVSKLLCQRDPEIHILYNIKFNIFLIYILNPVVTPQGPKCHLSNYLTVPCNADVFMIQTHTWVPITGEKENYFEEACLMSSVLNL